MRTRRLCTLLAAVVLAVSGSTIIAAPAHAAFAGYITPPTSGWAEIFPPYITPTAHVCLDVPGGTSQEWAELQLYHCHGYAANGAPQRWSFVYLPSLGKYWVVSVASGKCLSQKDYYLDPAEHIYQVTCTTDWWDLWMFARAPADPNLFMLTHGGADFGGGFCMTALNNSGANGTRLQVASRCDLSSTLNNTNLLQYWAFG